MTDAAGVRVRALAAGDLDEADRICRLAFGTFLGVPEPEKFFGDAGLVRTRWRADPGAALAAELGGRLAGSNFAANWGSVGFFGPRTVAPEYWDQGVAQRLLDATMDLFQAGGGPGTPGCSPSRRAPSTWACTRSTGSGRASSPPS